MPNFRLMHLQKVIWRIVDTHRSGKSRVYIPNELYREDIQMIESALRYGYGLAIKVIPKKRGQIFVVYWRKK
ncbi:MAG: hypothetical protein Q6363_008085 [Candidatus Njordarchaeota archaeon]